MIRLMNAIGRHLGRVNDRRFGPQLGEHPRPSVWGALDHIAGRLYVLGE